MPLWVGLVDTLGREPRAAEYRRQIIDLVQRDRESDFVNSNEIVFATSQQSWGAIQSLRIFDNSGEEICTFPLTVPKHVTPSITVSLVPHSVSIQTHSDLWEHLEEEIAFDERQLCLPDVQAQTPAPQEKKRDPDFWDMVTSDEQVV